MPHAIKNDLELREQGLVVILAESQTQDWAAIEQFVWKTFPTCESRVTQRGGNPLPDFSGLPTTAVIGADGKLVFMASPMGGGLDEAILAELKKIEKGWGDTAEERRARALMFGKKDYAGAKKIIDALQDAGIKDKLTAELKTQVEGRLAMAKALQASGRWSEAKDVITQVAGKTAGTEWQPAAAELVASLATPEGKKELALADKIDKFLKAYRAGKPRPAKDLEKVVADGAGTKAAERATKLLPFARSLAKT